MKGESFKISGIILRSHLRRESDLVLSVLSKNRGKLTLIAKHAKNSNRRFQGRLEILDKCEFDCKTFNEDFSILESSNLKSSYPELRNNLDLLESALAFSQIMDLSSFSENLETSESLYDLLDSFLKSLCSIEITPTNLLRLNTNFLYELIEILGLAEEAERSYNSGSLAVLIQKLQHELGKPLLIAEICNRHLKKLKA